MKTRLLKKVFTSILIVIAMLFMATANAQIVYIDLNPDSSISCNPDSTCIATYDLDLNHDGTNDFSFVLSRTKVTSPPCTGNKKNSSVEVMPLNGNETSGIKQDLGAAIDGSLNWLTSSQGLSSDLFICGLCDYLFCWTDWSSGNWTTQSEGYLPLKLIIGINIYYGWVRLKMGSNTKNFTIEDYAYDSIPNQLIFAGQDYPTGIATSFSENNFSVFPSPALDKIKLSFSSAEKKEIQIINTLRQKVFSATINSQQEEINLRQFPGGIYLMIVKTDSQTFEKKFLKE